MDIKVIKDKVFQFVKQHKNLIIAGAVAVLAISLVVYTLVANRPPKRTADGGGDTITASNVNPEYASLAADTTAATADATATAAPSTAQPTTVAPTTKPKATTRPTQAATTPTLEDIPFATAVLPATPADYSAQWELGYLLAIDNPDTSYACPKITLTDEDRNLLERLCMGEFGSGGFIGASLIAQAVKDAMCFDGYQSVAEVIRECRYTGSTDIGTSAECVQAVRYIFDDNHDAVQHRILYMYNPYMVQSSFHESQNFILSYAGVRFFDRWGS